MKTVFLSYSHKDRFFAELASIELARHGYAVWRDHGQLRAGTEWRQGIEEAISRSHAVLVALSPNSAESPYLTFEWSYALGRRKVVIPLKLAECAIHPRLEAVQYLDFSIPGVLPWGLLTQRIADIEPPEPANTSAVEPDTPEPTETSAAEEPVSSPPPTEDPQAKIVLSYLNERGFQMVSFDRLRRIFGEDLSDQQLGEIIRRNPTMFRRARLRGGKPGIAKLIP
jgi:hypothetical protein